MKSAIVIGASSGIGRELAKLLSQRGYHVGLTARRMDLLVSLQLELMNPSVIKQMDVMNAPAAMLQLQELLDEMQNVELVVINAGIGCINPDLDWQKEVDTIHTNVTGFAAMSNVALLHFIRQGSGQLVGISSIAALRGGDASPAYFASKAFVSNYLQGLRKKVAKLRLPITITDIQPGVVDTPMAQSHNKLWVAPADKAARQVLDAIIKKKKHAYVTKRWILIAWLIKILPDFLYHKI
jgi:short-subunit dehydrogenase